MRAWAIFLAGLILWAVHFLALYIVASVFLTTPLARVLTLLITALCLGAATLLFLRLRAVQDRSELDRWMKRVAQAGIGLAGVAILWQGLPALLV